MEQIKTENWNGHAIRFVWRNNDWWAVAKDVAEALGYDHVPHMVRQIDPKDKTQCVLQCDVQKVDTPSKARKTQQMTIITELGIYDCIFGSHKKEAKVFKRWVYTVIKTLRQFSGLEGFEVFRMLDKQHQCEAMNRLQQSLHAPAKVDYIIANIIADKAVSTKYGHLKMMKKSDMTPPMLRDRQAILEDTVSLMVLKDRYHLDLSVSKTIYGGCVHM